MADKNKCDAPTGQHDENPEQKEEFIPQFKDVSSFSEGAFRSMMAAIRSSNDLPTSGDDFDYYSSFESFRNLMDMEGLRILQMLQQILRYHGARGNVSTSSEVVQIEDKYDVLVDANDQLLERVGMYLDEAAGLRKQESPLVIATVKTNTPVSGSWNKKTPPGGRQRSRSSNFRLLAAKNIQRPQAKFKDKINNTRQPFVPKIKEKLHAVTSLRDSLMTEQPMETDTTETSDQFPHPYQTELDQLMPLAWQTERGEIIEPRPQDECPLTLVDTEQQLAELLEALMAVREFAVDLEAHQYRSFQGLTCLMQLSTRDHDYIVDTLALRNDLHVLNQVFTDPTILKVFHGADSDIVWLQRDFGIYVVNMFDTGQASRVLNLPRFSLAYLLSTYCQIEADKQYQLADWRIRPLPQELVRYAREDTHSLLYIYDRLRTELIERGNSQKNLLLAVLQRSTQVCTKRYEKPRFKEDHYIELHKRSKKVFNSQQLSALKGLFQWRDALARQEDESLGYVLPNHMLLQICENLPRDPQGVIACCNPTPPLVRQHLNEVHSIIKTSRDQPLRKVAVAEEGLIKPSSLQHPKYNANRFLRCPHDLSHTKTKPATMVTDLPTAVSATESSSLYQNESKIHICKVKVKEIPSITCFEHSKNAQTSLGQAKAMKIKGIFNNPILKFLPDEILSRNEMQLKEKRVSMEQWKLLPHSKRMEMKPSSPTAPIPQAEVATEDMITFNQTTEAEPVTSLRQQKHKSQKRPSDSASDVMAEAPKKVREDDPGQAKVQRMFAAPPEDFKAYDYQTLAAAPQDPGQRWSRTDYDPASGTGHTKKPRGAPRSGAFSGRGKKSMTYSNTSTGSSGNTSKIQWPRR